MNLIGTTAPLYFASRERLDDKYNIWKLTRTKQLTESIDSWSNVELYEKRWSGIEDTGPSN